MVDTAAAAVLATTRRHFLDEPVPRADLRCTLSDLLSSLLGAQAASPVADRVLLPVRRVACGSELIHEGAPFQNLYFVRTGMFKFARCDEEGYEQVLGFAVRGDVVGMDGVDSGHYAASVVALEDASAAVVPFSELQRLETQVPAMRGFLHHCASRELRRSLEALQLVSAVGAEVRLARFLLDLSRRHVLMGHSGRRLVLRMSRRDIASYLGLAHETVSRAFTALANGGYLTVSQREIEIIDPEGLHSFQRSTRRAGEAGAVHRPSRQGAAVAYAGAAQGVHPLGALHRAAGAAVL